MSKHSGVFQAKCGGRGFPRFLALAVKPSNRLLAVAAPALESFTMKCIDICQQVFFSFQLFPQESDHIVPFCCDPFALILYRKQKKKSLFRHSGDRSVVTEVAC